MAIVAVTTSPTTLDSGSSEFVTVTNTGTVDVTVARGSQSFVLRPTQGRTVYPEGASVTASVVSGSGQVTTAAQAAQVTQAQQLAANTAAIAGLPGTYAISKQGIYVPGGWGSFWKPKRNAAGSAKATVAVMGDSITAGYYASNLQTLGWVGLMRTALQSTYGNGGGGFVSVAYEPTLYGANGYTGLPVSLTGTWVKQTAQDGPNGACVISSTANSTLSFTVTGTSATLYYPTQASYSTGGGTFTVSVDGGTGQTLNSAQATAIRTYTFSGLSAGTHTVTLTVPSGGGFAGAYGVSGENTTGIVVNNFGHSGYQSGAFATAGTFGHPADWSGGQNYPADLFVYALGVNDANNAVAADTYINNARAALSHAKEQGTLHGALDVAFVLMPVGKYDNNSNYYHAYATRVRGVAEAFGAAVFDLWSLMRNNYDYGTDISYWSGDAATGATGSSNVHPGNLGHAWIWSQISPYILAV